LKDRRRLNKNRSNIDIVHEILSIAAVKVRKTRIMYGANLSFLQIEKYLSALIRSGPLAHDIDSGYFITDTGFEFLKLYEDYIERSTRLRVEFRRNTEDRQQLENMCGFGKDAPGMCHK
jgi:predicted transcriptional regulator